MSRRSAAVRRPSHPGAGCCGFANAGSPLRISHGWTSFPDANALAAVVAPCIVAGDFQYQDAARAILRAAVLRWIDQGSGAQPALVAGPFGATPQSQPRRSLLWPSEIAQLQRLCGGGRGQAFAIDTVEVGS